MTAMGLLSIVAYGLFLAGAALSFRDNGSRASVRIMLAGIVLDIVLSFLPMFGIRTLGAEITVFSGMLKFTIAMGLVVWLCFFAALCARRKSRLPLYHGLILASEIGWFLSFISFLYGMFKFA